ncbi:hypothetical protein FA95DRAFT_1577809 [Auriscalpium vulgare]|uniref:Uncharacterized protein n=1 Tax=Auriscalpium vulgare TaxID=40419 RepID=A0ACB8R5E3_9AGAM|nr:hypothetical protein FA95DRAFT_1577809 [Auriscalpium vulgare]
MPSADKSVHGGADRRKRTTASHATVPFARPESSPRPQAAAVAACSVTASGTIPSVILTFIRQPSWQSELHFSTPEDAQLALNIARAERDHWLAEKYLAELKLEQAKNAVKVFGSAVEEATSQYNRAQVEIGRIRKIVRNTGLDVDVGLWSDRYKPCGPDYISDLFAEHDAEKLGEGEGSVAGSEDNDDGSGTTQASSPPRRYPSVEV